MTGAGFSPGEIVRATYRTGLPAPRPGDRRGLPERPATDGTFSCNGQVPTDAGGALGVHRIAVKGLTSSNWATRPFKLTEVAAGPIIRYHSSFVGRRRKC